MRRVSKTYVPLHNCSRSGNDPLVLYTSKMNYPKSMNVSDLSSRYLRHSIWLNILIILSVLNLK